MSEITDVIESLEIEMIDLDTLVIRALELNNQSERDILKEARDKVEEAIILLEEIK